MSDLINREELIEVLKDARAAGCVDPYRNGIRENICDEFLEIIEDRKMIQTVEAPHWIPVSERLPEHDDDVLVTAIYRGFRFVGVDRYLPEEEEWYHLGKDEVLAWLDMPQPYRGE